MFHDNKDRNDQGGTSEYIPNSFPDKSRYKPVKREHSQ